MKQEALCRITKPAAGLADPGCLAPSILLEGPAFCEWLPPDGALVLLELVLLHLTHRALCNDFGQRDHHAFYVAALPGGCYGIIVIAVLVFVAVVLVARRLLFCRLVKGEFGTLRRGRRPPNLWKVAEVPGERSRGSLQRSVSVSLGRVALIIRRLTDGRKTAWSSKGLPRLLPRLLSRLLSRLPSRPRRGWRLAWGKWFCSSSWGGLSLSSAWWAGRARHPGDFTDVTNTWQTPRWGRETLGESYPAWWRGTAPRVTPSALSELLVGMVSVGTGTILCDGTMASVVSSSCFVVTVAAETTISRIFEIGRAHV